MQEGSKTVMPGASVYVPHQEQPATTALDMNQLLREANAAARKQSTKKDSEQHAHH